MSEQQRPNSEYGRFQLLFTPDRNTATLLIECVDRTEGFWVALREKWAPGYRPVIGHLRFKPIGRHIFELSEVRSADSPLHSEETPERFFSKVPQVAP